jgi:XTP/dITP diphosphohydrolase
MTIWFASGNAHKKMELAAILNAGDGAPAAYTIRLPADLGLAFEPQESGTSFYENALQKAGELHRLLSELRPAPYCPGDPVIADDSGLCVDALDGRPGIFSARYCGRYCGARIPGGTAVAANGNKLESRERNALLLAELGGNPRRSARFVCAMVLFLGPDRFFLAEETMEGEIVKSVDHAAGTGGVGYDPILYIPDLGRTVAELSDAEKNRISHRGKAGRAVANMLHALALE